MQTGTEQVLAEPGSGTNTANVTAERKQANQRLEKVPNRVWHLYATLLLENLGKRCREWPAGKTESEMKPLIQENSKQQDLIDGSVSKDQSEWGFTVK